MPELAEKPPKSIRVRVISEKDGMEMGTEWDEECLDAARLWKERGIVEYVDAPSSNTPPKDPMNESRQDKMIHADEANASGKSRVRTK